MSKTALTRDRLTRSVLAVPPLARKADLSLNDSENLKLIRHIETGGVRTLLYGGNANLYHVEPGEYERLLDFLERAVGLDTLVIPSVGPSYGMMMHQAKLLRRHRFAAAMVLPQQGMTTPAGVEEGIRRFVHEAEVPVLLYIKQDGYIEVENAARLASQGLICGIKYAVVRPDPADDPYLRRLVEAIDRKMIISGIGEQPAIVHMRDLGLGGFTSGCVCVAPRLSRLMLEALHRRDWDDAQRIRLIFKPLEDLRNAIHPVRVLHEAVRLAGIAQTGPLLPLMSNLPPAEHARVEAAVRQLLASDAAS